MFDDRSRYADRTIYPITDRRGRTVLVVASPDAPREAVQGFHLRRDGERLDHLAHIYLGHGPDYWRICELEDAMLPDALAEARELAIPAKGRR